MAKARFDWDPAKDRVNRVVRIFGAGYWRKGKQIYDRENQVHR
jgi:hypothetical protein